MKNFDSLRKDCQETLKNQIAMLAPLKGSKLLVTGGTGFVGSWIAEMIACLNDDHSFGTQLVLVSRGTEHFKDTRPHLAKRKDIQLLKSDIRNLNEVPKETEWIVHAASNPDNRFHASNPVETMTVIAEGTSTLLRAADRCENLKMFLNVSSGLIYGTLPVDMKNVAESYVGAPPAASTTSAYASAKRYAETFVTAARTQAHIPCAIVRPFAFVGPYQALDTPWALNNFLHDAMGGKAIRVYGDGQTTRSYLYGSDAAFWFLRALTGAQSGECYNLGSSEAITLEQLAHKVAKLFDPRPEIILKTQTTSAPSNSFIPDVTLAEKKLQLKVTVPLEKALEKTVKWNQQ